MKISTIIWILSAVLLITFLSLSFLIYDNSQKMINIDTARTSNVDSLEQMANIRGFSSRIHTIIHEDEVHRAENKSVNSNILFNKFVAEQTHYVNAVDNFKKILAEIETGESKRTEEEITEERSILNEALSSAARLSEQLEQYSQTKLEADEPENDLFETVFESSSAGINIERKHYDTLALKTNQLEDTNIHVLVPFSFISVVLLLAWLFFLLLMVVKPIREITNTIQSISLGKLDTEIKGKERKDEIGDLARAFERTIVSLKLAMRKTGKAIPFEEPKKKPEEKIKSAFKI